MRANRPNDALRRAMDAADYTTEQLAEAAGFHPKQVGRWLAEGVIPRKPSTKGTVADLLGVAEADIWPAVVANDSRPAEVVDVLNERAAVPRETWLDLINSSERHLDLFAFSATFFYQLSGRIGALLATAAGRGAQVRLCFAHPEADCVTRREDEERLLDRGVLASKARTALGYYRPIIDTPGVEVRLHDVTVYASLFRFDDTFMVNPHILGAPSSSNPLIRIQRTDEGHLFDAYTAAFEEAWEGAKLWTGDAV